MLAEAGRVFHRLRAKLGHLQYGADLIDYAGRSTVEAQQRICRKLRRFLGTPLMPATAEVVGAPSNVLADFGGGHLSWRKTRRPSALPSSRECSSAGLVTCSAYTLALSILLVGRRRGRGLLGLEGANAGIVKPNVAFLIAGIIVLLDFADGARTPHCQHAW